jgi:hypothetical protein
MVSVSSQSVESTTKDNVCSIDTNRAETKIDEK